MPRGKCLTQFERGEIFALHDYGKTMREIARRIHRSDRVVRNFLKSPASYGQKKRSGRRKKLSPRDERRIVHAATNTSKGCSTLKRELNLNVSRMTVWRVLDHTPHLERQRMRPVPRLEPHHKIARLEFGRANMNRDWHTVSILRKIDENIHIFVVSLFIGHIE